MRGVFPLRGRGRGASLRACNSAVWGAVSFALEGGTNKGVRRSVLGPEGRTIFEGNFNVGVSPNKEIRTV